MVVAVAGLGIYAWAQRFFVPGSEDARAAAFRGDAWAFVIEGRRLSLVQGLREPTPAGVAVRFGPGPWDELIREYCDALEPGSVRPVEKSGDYAAVFHGDRLLFDSVQRQMTRRYCDQ